MPAKLTASVYQTFMLEYTDLRYENDGDPTYVIVKKVRQSEHEHRQKLFSKINRKYSLKDPDSYTVIQEAPFEDLKRTEIWLTLVECNLVDEDGKPVFPSKKDANGNPILDMTKAEFDAVYDSLPPDIVNDIHGKVLEGNVIWSGLGE